MVIVMAIRLRWFEGGFVLHELAIMLLFFRTCLVIKPSFQQLCKTQCGRMSLASYCMIATDVFVTHLRLKSLCTLDSVALAMCMFIITLLAMS